MISLRPLSLALMGLGLCHPSLADISFEPSQVAVGQAHDISIQVDDPAAIHSISLQPAYPAVVEKIDLKAPAAGYHLKRADGLLSLFDEQGQKLAEFGNGDNGVDIDRLRYQAEGEAGLVAYKRRGWERQKQIGQFRTSEAALDTDHSNGLAAIATGRGGLTVLDVSTPIKPRWLGSHQKLGNTIKVSSEGDRVAVLNDANIVYLIDLKNPREPTTLAAVRAEGPLRDLDLKGDTVYALGDEDIQVIDFSTHSPQISNEGLDFGQGVNLGGERRVYIENNLAYVADWFSGIHIYDISRPRQPELLASYHTPGSPKGMVVRDGIAYVPDDDHGLAILDVSDPRNPRHISTLLTEGLAYTPRLVGDLLYLASHRGGFQIIDVSDIKNPRQLSEFDTEGKAWSMEVRDNIAYVADDDSGLLSFDVSDPSKPVQIGQYYTGAAAEEVVIRDNIAFVAYYDDGLHILDISDPRSIQPISRLSLPGNARGLDLVGDTLYVAGWLAGIHTVDVTDLQQPTLMGSYDTRGATWGLQVQGTHLFAMDWWGGISVIDVSDPHRPKAAGGYHNRGLVHDIASQGNYAFVAQGSNGLQVFDIKNALHPTWTTGTSLPGQARSIAIKDERAYIAAGDGGVAVMDISNPFHVRWLGSVDSRGEVDQLVIDQDSLYVRDSRDGVVLFDISAAMPRKLKSLDIAAHDLALHQGRLYLATDEGVKIAERDQGHLNLVAQATPTQTSQRIAIHQQHIYLANDGQFSILPLAQPDRHIKQIDLPSRITDLEISDLGLLVSTEASLLILNPDGSIKAEYPLITDASQVHYHQGTVYISGEETIAAVQPLAEISQTLNGQAQITLSLPMDLSIGNYQLRVLYNDGSTALVDQPLRVEMPKFSKPKMTMEDFKRLMQQEKDSDIFVKPSPETNSSTE